MAYTDVDKLKTRYSEAELIDLASETDSLDAAALLVITQCISDSDEEIDSYLRNQYDTPIDPVPDLLNKISSELTIVNLYKKRNVFNEDMQTRYKWVADI